MPLCKSCRAFDCQKILLHSTGSQPAGIPVETVCKGYEEGCDFCTLLFSRFEDDIVSFRTSGADASVRVAFLVNNHLARASTRPMVTALGAWVKHDQVAEWRTYPVRSMHRNSVASDPYIRLPVAADYSSTAAESGFIAGRFLGLKSDSTQHITAIKGWIKDCESHPRCGLENNLGGVNGDVLQPVLPTRCLEVTSKSFILRETGHLHGSFVILSHRWTEETEQCRTTVNNYQDRLRGHGLDFTSTFRDAIDVTIELGYRYIWIDSICIIQKGDDYADWRRETLKMAQYYKTAALTIFAVVPRDKGGIFRSREIPFKQSIRMTFRDSQGIQKGHFYVLDRPTDWRSEFQTSVRHSPLLQRGWILQEWFLSRRIVYFTLSGIFFECLTEYPKNEAQEEPDHEKEDLQAKWAIEKAQVPDFKTNAHRLISNPLSLWYVMVEMYAALELKHPEKDRIMAIAGIAKEIRDILIQKDCESSGPNGRYEYVAGLWLRDIHHGLLWTHKHIQDGPNSYTSIEGIPSWSWASLTGPVSWENAWQWRQYSLYPLRGKPAMEVVALVTKQGMVYKICPSVDGTTKLIRIRSSNLVGEEPASENSDDDEPEYVIGPFDVDNSFTRLRISASAVYVVIRSYLAGGQYAFMRFATGCTTNGQWRENLKHVQTNTDSKWLQICPLSNPSILGGWASIETPSLINQLESFAGTSLLAVHISTRTHIVGGAAYGYGGFRETHNAYNVILVQSTGDGKFSRAGMGCVFDKSIAQEFDAAPIISSAVLLPFRQRKQVDEEMAMAITSMPQPVVSLSAVSKDNSPERPADMPSMWNTLDPK
ncbi:MAG: hypothetical protein M1839_004607 [Geoglossum umbratile]|nr:MAG: hypothetical protein M1839_004607 [Geoglossum umbratile]